MKFTKSKKEPKKSPEEEYAEHISTLTENELRDLHKDLKIDHYGNSTAAVINTAAGVGLFSLRSTIRRDRTECMQIDVIEARMKDMAWTPHPTRYRDAVPIALGVAAGTTSGMTFGLINVEKNAKRTKDYVKRKDLFKTKEMVRTEEVDAECDKDDVLVEEAEVAEPTLALLQTTPEQAVSETTIARKPVPVPGPAATYIEAVTPQPEVHDIVTETTKDTSALSAEPPPLPTETRPLPYSADPSSLATTEPKTSKKKETLLAQVSVVVNKKMRGFSFKKDDGKAETQTETVVSVTEIAGEVDGSVMMGTDTVVVKRLDSPPPMYAKECVA